LEPAEVMYQRLIEPIEEKMIGIVGRIVRDPDEAADVFQDVLAEIWARLRRINRHPNPRGYILRICISRSYDALRRRAHRRRREKRLARQSLESIPAAPPNCPTEGLRAKIRDLIGLLPPQQGKAVLLRLLDETSYRDIARILGCSEASARVHFSRGKERLGRLLQRRGWAEGTGA